MLCLIVIHTVLTRDIGRIHRQHDGVWHGFDAGYDSGADPELSCIILNGQSHISETVHPIQFVFGSRVKV